MTYKCSRNSFSLSSRIGPAATSLATEDGQQPPAGS
jgi:hypothetical protein